VLALKLRRLLLDRLDDFNARDLVDVLTGLADLAHAADLDVVDVLMARVLQVREMWEFRK
jgi:hypothetical protein